MVTQKLSIVIWIIYKNEIATKVLLSNTHREREREREREGEREIVVLTMMRLISCFVYNVCLKKTVFTYFFKYIHTLSMQKNQTVCLKALFRFD